MACSTSYIGPAVVGAQLDGVRDALSLAVGARYLIVAKVPHALNMPAAVACSLCLYGVYKVVIPPEGRWPKAYDPLFKDKGAIGVCSKLAVFYAGPSQGDKGLADASCKGIRPFRDGSDAGHVLLVSYVM